jgi:hypothetical protein
MTDVSLPQMTAIAVLAGCLIAGPAPSRAADDAAPPAPRQSAPPQDDIWGISQVLEQATYAEVNGRVTHGDSLVVRVVRGYCEEANLFTSVYTMADNPDVLTLDGQDVTIELNGETAVSTIRHPMRFLSGYRFIVDLGFVRAETLKTMFGQEKQISIKLVNSDALQISDYVDVARNNWSLTGAPEAIERAQKICRDMDAPRAIS